MSNLPRKPIHMQRNLVKAKSEQKNPSFESFQDHEQHPSNYAEHGAPSTHGMSRIRRYPDGTLDMQWAANLIIDAVKKAEYNGHLTDLEESFLTVVFPLKFPKKEAGQAEVNTQLSRAEKEKLKAYVEAHFAEELNWNAGRGGGSVDGRTRTLNGGN